MPFNLIFVPDDDENLWLLKKENLIPKKLYLKNKQTKNPSPKTVKERHLAYLSSRFRQKPENKSIKNIN